MTSITEKVISICVTFIHLLLIQQISHEDKYKCRCKSYEQGLPGWFVRQNVSYDNKAHQELAHIITILGKVVYLFLVHGVVLLTEQSLCLEPDIAYFIDKSWVLLI